MPRRTSQPSDRFREHVQAQESRMVDARRRGDQVWRSLGTIGLIGWSVVLPTVAGAGIGMWLDSRYPSRHSWTLALIVAGVVVGCYTAWHWVAKEAAEIRKEDKR